MGRESLSNSGCFDFDSWIHLILVHKTFLFPPEDTEIFDPQWVHFPACLSVYSLLHHFLCTLFKREKLLALSSVGDTKTWQCTFLYHFIMEMHRCSGVIGKALPPRG